MSELELEEFLKPISESLGHAEVPAQPTGTYDASHGLARERYERLTPDELADWFAREGAAIGVTVRRCTPDELAQQVAAQATAFGAQRVMLADDPRVDSFGIGEALFTHGIAAARWDAQRPQQSLDACKQADVGVTFPWAGIAHSATVAQQCDEHCGRSVSLLPPAHISVVGTSSLVPRLIDVLERLDDAGADALPSSLVFITGPSATADIELVRVVGVHGPMQTAVILVDE